MTKRVLDLLRPDLPPPRQPHTAIVALLLRDTSQAYTVDEILDAVRSLAPEWRVTSDQPITQRVVVESALDDLVMTGAVVELADEADRYYALLPTLARDRRPR